MKARVGMRRLRAELASYVWRANAGESVVITVDGKPCAQLVPLGKKDLSPLHQLAADGRAQPPASPDSEAKVSSTSQAARSAVLVGPDIARLMTRIRG